MAFASFSDALPHIPPTENLNEDIILEWAKTKQCVKSGRAIFACGGVRGLELLEDRRRKHDLRCFVQSELKRNTFYRVIFKPERSNVTKDACMTCACAPASTSRRCKHRTAFLFALLSIRDFHNEIEYPIHMRRKGVARMFPKKLWDDPRYFHQVNQVRANLSWGQMLREILDPITKKYKDYMGVTLSRNLVENNLVGKKRKKKVFCYCENEYDDEGPLMVKCSGNSAGCKGGWYHTECVSAIEKVEFKKNSRGGIDGDFVCRLCLFQNDLLRELPSNKRRKSTASG